MKCEFVKTNGEPCQANALPDKTLCFWHDPGNAAKRAQARKKGGHNRQTRKGENHGPYAILSVADIMTALNDALNDAALLENSHARSRSIGYICQIMLKGMEVGEIEKRLEALEQRIGGNHNGHRKTHQRT